MLSAVHAGVRRTNRVPPPRTTSGRVDNEGTRNSPDGVDGVPSHDAPASSAAVEALDASLEACLKSAAALGAAPTGAGAAAARLAAKADRLAAAVALLGDGTPKSDGDASTDEEKDGPLAAPGPSYWDHAREWQSSVNLGDSARARNSPRRHGSWRALFNRRVLLGLVSGHEDPDDPKATGKIYPCMLSPQSTFRLAWDLFIAVVLTYVAIVEPLSLGFSGFRHMTRADEPLGVINRIVDVVFLREPPRHRADAVTGTTSRRWRRVPEI